MTIQQQQQLLCSTMKVHNRTRYYGNADIIPVMVLSMIYDLRSQCISLSDECLLKLDMLVAKMELSQDVCQTRGSMAFFEGNEKIIPIRVRPKSSFSEEVSLHVDSNSLYLLPGPSVKVFQQEDFLKNYNGIEPEYLIIVTLPRHGTLKYKNVNVKSNDVIPFTDISNLIYHRSEIDTYQDPFIFQVSDKQLKLTTNMANFTINVDGKINEPPIVGDGSAVTPYNETLIFTREMFTTNTTPPYHDPEGDLPLKLKITSLPTKGTMSLRGVPLIVNQELDFINDIDTGSLIYIPDGQFVSEQNIDFTFAIMDSGSGQYSE